MATIGEITFRNFKSFRNTHISLGKGFNCVVGPNGAGKSNICDGIRFAFGESSLRALRARKVQDLISSGSEKAVIRMKVEDGNGAAAEIIRAIRKDGKTLYRLNGKRATRSLVIEFLKSEGLDVSQHNVIAQGEVEKIIRMTPKERREIIDDIAGVAEFESKKKESLSELGKVEQKLNDASIVMKEREGILEELGTEKDAALKFLSLKDEQRRVKGTLVITTYKKSELQFTSLVNKCMENAKERGEFESQLQKMTAESSEIGKQLQEASSKITGKDTQRIYAEVEELRGKISTDLGVKTEKEKEKGRADNESNGLKEEEKDINERLSSFSGAKRSAASRAAELKKRLEILEKEREKVSGAWTEKRKRLKELDDVIDEKNEEMSKLQQDLTKFSTQKEMKQPSGDKEKKKDIEREIGVLEKNVEKFEDEVDALFNKEKGLNEEIRDIDSSILSKKEEIASMRGAGRAPLATATSYVMRLKESNKIPGVFGTVGDLFQSDKKYEIAAESAAGGRLNYVVVKDSETATEIVKLLKKDNAGRATFIPLDVIVLERNKEERKGKGIVGKIVDLIQCDPRFESVFKYVFGDTLVVENVDVFKSTSGVRMVTLDGDLAEASGIITGGASIKRSVRGAVKVEQLERDVDGLKARRESIIGDLRSISDVMSKMRRKVAEQEIRKKELEIELGAYKEMDIEDISKSIIDLQADIEDVERSMLDIRAEKERIRIALENSEDEKEKAKFENEIIGIKTEVATIEEKLKSGEVILLEERLSAIGKRKTELEDQLKEVQSEIKEIDKRMKQNEKELGAKEEKIKDESKILDKIYAKMKELQSKFDEMNVERGKLERRIDKVKEELIRNDANKDALSTRLADLKAEADLYKDVEPVSMKREDLETRVSELETELQTIGFVNLKAPEMYDERLKDYNDVKGRVNILSTEKEAVVKMIDEIELRKKEVFMKTYDAVSEHFKKLATNISKYEAFLTLENPEDPFMGGLHIIVKAGGKNGRNVELMSGGEKSLMTLVFVFALHMYKPSQFYILDETEAALDKENSKRFAELVKELSKETQFIVVSHNDSVIPFADVALGVTKSKQGSKIVGIKLMQN